MAESRFQTFDLGRVIQTAEAIKGMRQQSMTDRLQQQYLNTRIAAEQQSQDLAQKKFTEEQRIENTKWMVGASEHVLSLPADQQAQAMAVAFEEGKRRGIVPPEKQMPAFDPNGLRDFITNARVQLGAIAQPVSSQGKLVQDQRSGFLTPEQVEAANAPKAPSSFDEFTRSQKDPEYRKFLESRRGKGFSMTLPDGTVVEMGGPGAGVGPGELSKPTINSLQETIVNNTNRLDRLNQMMTTYNPEYLRARGLLKAGSAELKDFLGMDLSDEQRKYFGGYSEFRSNASQEFSATLKELSGTAASEGEVARVIKGVPSDQDKSPEVFEAKARATTKFITRAIMRANWALKNGIGVNSVDELSKRMPLEGIDGVFESRANQIWQELGGTPETRDQAMQKAQEEFGLAR